MIRRFLALLCVIGFVAPALAVPSVVQPVPPLTSAAIDAVGGDVQARAVAASLPRGITPVAQPSILTVLAAPPTITYTDGGAATATTITGGVLYPASSAAFRYNSTPMQSVGGGFAEYYGTTTTGGVRSDYLWYNIEFYSDSPLIELRLFNYNASTATVFVDDQLATASFNRGSTNNTRHFAKLDWTADASPRKVRFYRISGVGVLFAGVFLDPTGSIWYPSDRVSRKLLYFMSDSYGAGIGASYSSHIPQVLAAMLGMDVYVDGISSARWDASTSGSAVTRVNAILAAMPRKPDVIVNALGYNDASTGQTAATVTTNMASAIAAERGLAPNARNVTLGPWTPLGTSTALTNMKATIAGQAVASGSTFVDIESVINTANSGTYGNGDNVHPNAAGHTFIGRRAGNLLSPLSP